jgi:hypothetical protein
VEIENQTILTAIVAVGGAITTVALYFLKFRIDLEARLKNIENENTLLKYEISILNPLKRIILEEGIKSVEETFKKREK